MAGPCLDPTGRLALATRLWTAGPRAVFDDEPPPPLSMAKIERGPDGMTIRTAGDALSFGGMTPGRPAELVGQLLEALLWSCRLIPLQLRARANRPRRQFPGSLSTTSTNTPTSHIPTQRPHHTQQPPTTTTTPPPPQRRTAPHPHTTPSPYPQTGGGGKREDPGPDAGPIARAPQLQWNRRHGPPGALRRVGRQVRRRPGVMPPNDSGPRRFGSSAIKVHASIFAMLSGRAASS